MKFSYIFLLISALLISGCDDSNSSSSSNVVSTDDVQYEFQFDSNWNGTNFPTNYPSAAHFSGLIGTTHNNQIQLFTNSELASLGVIEVAETGDKGTLRNEINMHITNTYADKIIDGGGIPNGSNSVSLTFSANTSFPYLSIIAMVAPSPDWFVGINSLNLYEGNVWVDNKVINLFVYDAGSDDGNIFTSPNMPSSPKQVITRLTTDASDTDFLSGIHKDNGTYIGTITLKLKK